MNAVVDCVYAPAMTLMAVFFLGESPSRGVLLGGLLILSAILVGSATRPQPGRSRADLFLGLAYGAAGMVLVSASIIFLKPRFTNEDLLPITTIRLLVGTVFLVPLVLCRSSDRRTFSRLLRPSAEWKIAIPGSVLGAGLAMLAWIAAFTLIDVTVAAALNQFSTIYIFVLATVVLKEPLTVRRSGALLLALSGALIVIFS
jgi:drug/metabolite transporter (DMT)-like permease